MPRKKKSPLDEAPSDAEPLTLKDADAPTGASPETAPRPRRRRSKPAAEEQSEVLADLSSSEVHSDAADEIVPQAAIAEASADLAEGAAATAEVAAETAATAAQTAEEAAASAEALEAELVRQLEEVGRRID